MGLCVLEVNQFSMLLALLFFGYRSILFALAFFYADDDQRWSSNLKKSRDYGSLLIFVSTLTLYYVSCQ